MVMTIRFASVATMVGVAFLPLVSSSSTMTTNLPWDAPAIDFQKQLKSAISQRMKYQTSHTQKVCQNVAQYSCQPYGIIAESDTLNDDKQSIVPIFEDEFLNTCLWEKYYNNDDVPNALATPCKEQMTKLLYMTSAYNQYLRFISLLVIETTCLHLVMASILIYIGAKITTNNVQETNRVKQNMLILTWSIFLLYASVMIPYAMLLCVAAVMGMVYARALPYWYCIVYVLAMNVLTRLGCSPGVLMIVDAASLFLLGLTALLYSWRWVEHVDDDSENDKCCGSDDEMKYYLVIDEENESSRDDEVAYEGVPLSMCIQTV